METNHISNIPDLDQLDLVVARNGLLDVFADLELAVTKIVRSNGVAPSTEPFGNRLNSFRNAERTSLIAKANFARRDQLADAIAKLLPVRADIVHSRMKPCVLDGQCAGLFINSQEACSNYPTGRIITLQQLRELAHEIVDLAKQVAALNRLNPPSSPLPPSPDAAGGP